MSYDINFNNQLLSFKHFYSPDDQFFYEGNAQKLLLTQQLYSHLLITRTEELKRAPTSVPLTTHICSTCKRKFPTYYVLQLHLEEAHSPFFYLKVKSKKNENLYKCLYELCTLSFKTPKERKIHWASTHSNTLTSPPPFILHNKTKQKKINEKNKDKMFITD